MRRKTLSRQQPRKKSPAPPKPGGLPLSAWIVIQNDDKEYGFFCLNNATPDEAGLTLLFFHQNENSLEELRKIEEKSFFYYVPEKFTLDFIDHKTAAPYGQRTHGPRSYFLRLWESVEEKSLSDVHSSIGWFYYFRDGRWHYATWADNFQSWRTLRHFAENNEHLTHEYFERHRVSGHLRLALFSRALGLEL
jgi:hypothetical protein